jgi:hypothetical protein
VAESLSDDGLSTVQAFTLCGRDGPRRKPRICARFDEAHKERGLSYVIQIWEQPADLALPAGSDAVWQMLDGLVVRSPGPNPKYRALAHQLMALYPQAGAGVGHGAIWRDGHAHGDGEALVWRLGLCRGAWLEAVHAVVVSRANALGLHVADEQTGRLFLARRAVPVARHWTLVDETPTEPVPLEALPLHACGRSTGR